MKTIARVLLGLLLAAPLGCYTPPLKDDCSCCEGEAKICKGCGKALKDGKPCDCGKTSKPKP